MTVIVALCLVVYTTLPETGDRGDRATVAPTDPEVLEGEHLLASSSSASGEAKRSS
jgi:MFS transporter, MHS family, alpha-ketoglutarate permease